MVAHMPVTYSINGSLHGICNKSCQLGIMRPQLLPNERSSCYDSAIYCSELSTLLLDNNADKNNVIVFSGAGWCWQTICFGELLQHFIVNNDII